jgi:glyoxylase-like metal-dependent hydrolase (beta-lactamase superfamily II)
MIKIKRFTFNPVTVNTYLLYDETKEAAVIDCGCFFPQEQNTLSRFIEENQLHLKKLLSTHYHFDHVIGNAYIYHRYNIRPEMNRDEFHTAPKLNTQMARFNLPQSMDDVEPEKYIEDNEEIHFGNSILKALLVPGHSPGSLAFYSEADSFVIVGDVLFKGSIGRTDLWGGDYDTLITSIQNRLFPLPDPTVVYPGHGHATTIAFEKKNNKHFTN